MCQRSAGRTILVSAIVVLIAGAGVAIGAASPALPRAGAWKLTPIGSQTGLVSAAFTVTGRRTVVDLHARFKRIQACAGGSAEVKGTLKMRLVTVGNGIREWAVAGGRNPSGGLSAVPVDLTIGGTKQVDATLNIGFPTKGQRGAGELNWGRLSGGIQPCVNAYYVVAG
jgi:hypothetical protein